MESYRQKVGEHRLLLNPHGGSSNFLRVYWKRSSICTILIIGVSVHNFGDRPGLRNTEATIHQGGFSVSAQPRSITKYSSTSGHSDNTVKWNSSPYRVSFYLVIIYFFSANLEVAHSIVGFAKIRRVLDLICFDRLMHADTYRYWLVMSNRSTNSSILVLNCSSIFCSCQPQNSRRPQTSLGFECDVADNGIQSHLSRRDMVQKSRRRGERFTPDQARHKRSRKDSHNTEDGYRKLCALWLTRA